VSVTLREYQQQGYEWLHFLHTYHFSGILADDMGLGKTIQTLVFLDSLYAPSRGKQKKLSPSLIVVPTSLVLNWMDEAAKFAPQLSIDYIRDGKTGMNNIDPDTEIIIVSYGILANLVEQTDIREKKWYYIILDEAQNIKNSKSERAKAIVQLTSSYRLALSGTPIENNLLELLSIFQFLMPGFLGQETRFRERYMG
jgi:SNF2 family DNA or RNA helicase